MERDRERDGEIDRVREREKKRHKERLREREEIGRRGRGRRYQQFDYYHFYRCVPFR